MDRGPLLAHLNKTRFAPGDRFRAHSDAREIAQFLRREYAVTGIWGIGSAFAADRSFYRTSDIDLVVKELPPGVYFTALSRCSAMTNFELDLIPYETATPMLIGAIEREGVAL